jgi:hypothetical protein
MLPTDDVLALPLFWLLVWVLPPMSPNVLVPETGPVVAVVAPTLVLLDDVLAPVETSPTAPPWAEVLPTEPPSDELAPVERLPTDPPWEVLAPVERLPTVELLAPVDVLPIEEFPVLACPTEAEVFPTDELPVFACPMDWLPFDAAERLSFVELPPELPLLLLFKSPVRVVAFCVVWAELSKDGLIVLPLALLALETPACELFV